MATFFLLIGKKIGAQRVIAERRKQQLKSRVTRKKRHLGE
jgi:hypothetical protein